MRQPVHVRVGVLARREVLVVAHRGAVGGTEVGRADRGAPLDGRVPAGDAAGHALEDRDLAVVDADEVAAARVEPDRGQRDTEHEHDREEPEQEAAKGSTPGSPPVAPAGARLPRNHVVERGRILVRVLGGVGDDRHRHGWQRLVGDGDHDHGHVVFAAGGVGGVDEAGRGARRVGLASELGGDEVGLHHAGEAVGAEQQPVAGDELDGVHVDFDRLVDTERPGDDRPLRVHRGFVGGEPAVAHELFDEAVVGGDLAQLAVVQEVRPRVADVADEQGAPRGERARGDGGAHAAQGGVGQRLVVHRAVGFLDGLAQRPPGVTAARSASTAVALATSPPRWPPMPSATAIRPMASSTR